MICVPGLAIELPGSNNSCATLNVRECLAVRGLEVRPTVINQFDASTNPNQATPDVTLLYLFSGAEVTLAPGTYDGQRVDVVLLEPPGATCVVTVGGATPTYKTNGDGLIPHYSLVLYWSETVGEWVGTDAMQWDF